VGWLFFFLVKKEPKEQVRLKIIFEVIIWLRFCSRGSKPECSAPLTRKAPNPSAALSYDDKRTSFFHSSVDFIVYVLFCLICS